MNKTSVYSESTVELALELGNLFAEELCVFCWGENVFFFSHISTGLLTLWEKEMYGLESFSSPGVIVLVIYDTQVNQLTLKWSSRELIVSRKTLHQCFPNSASSRKKLLLSCCLFPDKSIRNVSEYATSLFYGFSHHLGSFWGLITEVALAGIDVTVNHSVQRELNPGKIHQCCLPGSSQAMLLFDQ